MKSGIIRKVLSLVIVFAMAFQQTGLAQGIMQMDISRHMPALASQDTYRPLHLRYFSYEPLTDNFRILIDKGDLKVIKDNQIKTESQELLKYFLVGVALPDDNFWVNLRPDSAKQIIERALEKTDMGKVLLEADLQLKKDVAKFTSPETAEGRAYWNKLYKKAEEIFQAENVTIPTLTRPWIVPGEVIIRETANSAYVYKATLKVMLEQDYMKGSAQYNFSDPRLKELNEYSSQLIRETIIPKLTREINSSARYAPLRQVFYSLILSRWFKARFAGQSGMYASLINSGNLKGLTSSRAWSKTTYFKQYHKSFSQGEYNLKEKINGMTGPVIRTYFSGGVALLGKELNVRPTTTGSPVGIFNGNNPLVSRLLGRKMIPLSGKAADGNLLPALKTGLPNSQAIAGSPIQWTELTSQQIPAAFGDVLTGFGLAKSKIEVVRLKGDLSPEVVLRRPETDLIVNTSINQALGSRLFAGVGTKEGKNVADANAVEFSRLSILSFTQSNPNEAILVIADEGERDDSVSLKRGRIYWSGYKTGYWDPDPKSFVKSLEDEIRRLRAQGIKINYFAGDALEHTNGLIIKDALTNPTNSWSVASLFDDATNGTIRLTVWDRFRIAGVSFNAPTDAGVEPLDLPSVATRKVAAALAKEQNKPERGSEFEKFYADFINHLAILTLGARDKDLAKPDVQSSGARHGQIIDDAKQLRERYPGLKILTPGDGDFDPRVVASLGLDLGDGYKMMVFGRSGATEGTIAALVAKLTQNGQFNHRFLSEKETAKEVSSATAERFTEEDIRMFKELGYSEGAHLRTNTAGDIRGGGVVAITAVTGASAEFFGQELSELLQRVIFDKENNTVTTNTLVVTPDGSAFVIRSTFNAEFLATTEKRILEASPEAIAFIDSEAGEAFLATQQISSPILGAVRKPMVGGNWKMEKGTREEARQLLIELADKIRDTGGVDTVIAPSFVHIPIVADALQDLIKEGKIAPDTIKIAAQNMYAEEKGAFTAGISAQQLKDLGVTHVILGHSEVRRNAEQEPTGESNSNVNKKAKTALQNGLTPIICVGESAAERKAGNEYSVVAEQVSESLAGISPEDSTRVVVAYEPVWAIGAKALRAATPEEAQDMHSRIRQQLTTMYDAEKSTRMRIIYGGSVKPSNIAGLMAQPDIDGALVGGASLKADDFSGIVEGAAAGSPVGGIDFRVINMATQPMGNLAGLNFNLPKVSNIENISLDKEFKQIQKMLQAGITPSGERLKEFFAACYQKGELKEHLDGIVTCLVDTCKLEEEKVTKSSNGLKETLLIVDSIR